MRHPVALLILTGCLTACSPSDSTDSDAPAQSGTSTIKVAPEDTERAAVKAIAIKGGCFGCHDFEQTRFGPAWKLVAERYRGQAEAADSLFNSVKYGSGGKWQEEVGNRVMPPNEDKVTDREIKRIISFILGL